MNTTDDMTQYNPEAEALARAQELLDANRHARETECQEFITAALQQTNCILRAEILVGSMIIPVPFTIKAR